MTRRFEDDDDWVGTPPEGRHSRDRAKPEFWLTQKPVVPAAGFLVLLLIVVVLIAVA